MITHNAADQRFESVVPGGTGVLEYRLQGDRIYLLHVEVPPDSRGQGHAAELTKAALDWAVDAKLKIVPICPFTVSYMRRHPEYQAA